jgi:hypothetical protein
MIPKISLENLKLSKFVCGTNPFVGITHRWNPFEMLAHLRRYKEPLTVAKVMMHLLQEHGVNCCVSSPRDKVYEAIKIVERETGERFHWICTPSKRNTAKNIPRDEFKQIDWCADRNITVCGMQRAYTDRAIDIKKLKIGENNPKFPSYPELSAYIRDKGMIPVISSHYYQTIYAAEKNKYDAALIFQPVNFKGYMSNTNPEHLVEVIQKTNLQILAIKPLAAGRIAPKEGFSYILESIKENDFIAVGFGNFEQCVEDGKIIEEILNSN